MKFLIIQKGDIIPAEMIIYLKNQGEVDKTDSLENIKIFFYKIIILSPQGFCEEEFYKILKLLGEERQRFVVFSDRKDREFILSCYNLGCDHFISPPISMDLFEIIFGRNKLRNFLAKKLKTHDLDFWSQIDSLENMGLGIRPLLILGPTGVGKTKIAKLIHEYLFGTKNSFVEVNCSEISETLIESELFGYKKGAFTGAISDKKGLISQANGGTLFLDEIATMPLRIQKKVLKTLDEKSYLPVGAQQRETSEFYLISATCEDLEGLKELGKFRKDLFYRIEGFTLNVKSLSERRGDISILIDHFLNDFPRKIIFSDKAMEQLLSYNWPGNVRELLNFVECLRMVKGGIITENFLGRKFSKKQFQKESLFKDPNLIECIKEHGLANVIEGLEGEILNHFYRSNEGRVRKTTEDLKISNNTFYRIKKRISV
jgi:transcriptional regulator with PAS, ATPase and Fis domain